MSDKTKDKFPAWTRYYLETRSIENITAKAGLKLLELKKEAIRGLGVKFYPLPKPTKEND